jgi:hypothetical protein
MFVCALPSHHLLGRFGIAGSVDFNLRDGALDLTEVIRGRLDLCVTKVLRESISARSCCSPVGSPQ